MTHSLRPIWKLLLLLTLAAVLVGCAQEEPPQATGPAPTAGATAAATAPSTAPTVPPSEPVTVPTTAPTEPPVVFAPAMTDNSNPENWGIVWEIIQNGQIVDSYNREYPIHFGDPEDYYLLDGISTFRGNNYRNGATFGTANVTEGSFNKEWSFTVNHAINSGRAGAWAGCGWTGQPLVVRWDWETMQHMNLYEEKKTKDGLTEIIYATLAGRVYFIDLDDGSYTRDPLFVGMTFKGSGSLDPRGYPLLYVGSGDINGAGERPRMFVISLLDGSILYEYGHDEPMQLRTDNYEWCAFDSSPLIHADSDTLIWPGENGLLYTIRLNSQYDRENGTVSVSPDAPVAIRYDTARSGSSKYWYGMEASAAVIDHYLYVSENGGMFFCMDLNTMELVWAQDTADDSNSSPVVEYISEEEAYVYTAPSLHFSAGSSGDIHIYKLNALTGEIVWQVPYTVFTINGVSGGVQGTPLLGQPGTDLEGLIIYPVARYGARYSGILVALDTETGEEVWRLNTQLYSWSSPTAVYNDDGKSYIILGDADGQLWLIDGATGTVLDSRDIYANVEASPVVIGNRVVVGTRGSTISCFTVN